MALLLKLAQYSCERGDLTVLEHILPGSIKRIFYIANADGATRGGHRHYRAWQALVCLQGSVDVLVETGRYTRCYSLVSSDQCLVLQPNDWHLLENFRDSAIVLVISNEYYNEKDYIYERPSDETINIVRKESINTITI
ncbi:sugar 3,4-ketoisomerase [Spirosoma aerolatum]|uniref:sugar 3,4-ketoisomerase n=1 Tax=Spirosoma aerolatum TaxID=1211326 RepID=UPI0009ACCE4C|nr:FdtA/QdtA family cupin domain-containing protein [Spirosoma aerolatum]